MEQPSAKSNEVQVQAGAGTESKRGRKPRQQTEEIVRYFLAKEGSTVATPELGMEVRGGGGGAPGGPDALIRAFQSKDGIIYTVLAYKAEAEMQGGAPTLVKRPLAK